MPLCYTLGKQAGGWAHCKLAQALLCLPSPPNCYSMMFSFFPSFNGFYFNFKALSVLSCSASFFFFFLLCMVMPLEQNRPWKQNGSGKGNRFFPDFCISHLGSQLPKGPQSWPASRLRDGKRICFEVNQLQTPPLARHRRDECIYIFF